MLYRSYGRTGKKVSVIGFGSSRFKSSDLDSDGGLNRCADIVIKASNLGINNFDIAPTYAKSQCEKIFKIAFENIKAPFFVTAKSSSFQDPMAEDVLRRIENTLKNLGVDKIDFFYMWSIMNENHFNDIMKKGGAYEGALKAKAEGLIDHIVFSNHANTETAIKIIDSGCFEGITLSYNLLNYKAMEPIIQKANSAGLGIMVMNPLAGGIIPQNQSFFRNAFNSNKESIVQSAMKFVYSKSEVASVLSGISNENELLENVSALTEIGFDDSFDRNDMIRGIEQIDGFCTGCGYCRSICPKKLSIPEYMQSYNMMFLSSHESQYGRNEQALIQNINITKKLVMDYQLDLKDDNNPCIACKKCEEICTQHLPISNRFVELYNVIHSSCVSDHQKKKRLHDLLNVKKFNTVGFYTAGGYTAQVIDLYIKYFGQPSFNIVIFDSNASRWGEFLSGYEIFNPDLILSMDLDCIIISNYIYQEEIYSCLQNLIDKGVHVLKLHQSGDVPWIF